MRQVRGHILGTTTRAEVQSEVVSQNRLTNTPTQRTTLPKVLSLSQVGERWIDAGNPTARLEPTRPLWRLRLWVIGPTPLAEAPAGAPGSSFAGTVWEVYQMIVHKSLESTAYHEAGHAVACYLLRRGISFVSIRPKDGTIGRCFPTQIRRVDDAGELYPKLAEDEILIVLAGTVAEGVMTGFIEASLGSDGDRLRDIALRLCGDWERATVYLQELGLITTDTFRLPPVKAAVRALAQQLLKHHCLKGHAAIRVIRDALCNQELDA